MKADNIIRCRQEIAALTRAGVNVGLANMYLDRIESNSEAFFDSIEGRSAAGWMDPQQILNGEPFAVRRFVSGQVEQELIALRNSLRNAPEYLGNFVLNAVTNTVESTWNNLSNAASRQVDEIRYIISIIAGLLQEPWVLIIGSELAAELRIRVNVASGIIFDSSGNAGIIDTFSSGVTTARALSGGKYFAIIDAPTIHHVAGGSTETGGSVGAKGFYAGMEWTVTTGPERYYGVIFTFGMDTGTRLGASAHRQLSFSNISSTPIEILRRVLLGAPIELFISEWLEN